MTVGNRKWYYYYQIAQLLFYFWYIIELPYTTNVKTDTLLSPALFVVFSKTWHY